MSVPPLSWIAVVSNHSGAGEFMAFFWTLKQIGNGLRSKWHSVFFFCLMSFKLNSGEMRREFYAGCHSPSSCSTLRHIPLSFYILAFIYFQAKVFLLFCVNLFIVCWEYTVFNECHIHLIILRMLSNMWKFEKHVTYNTMNRL